MKKIILALMAAASLLGSCSKDNSAEEQSGQAPISITGGGVINAGPDGAEQAITVTSVGDWRLAGSCDWVHPSATSGKNGDVVTFTIDPNTGRETLEAQFKFFTGATVVPLKVISAPINELVLESKEPQDYDKKTHKLQVKLQTNIPELSMAFSDDGEAWIHFDNRSEGFGSTIMTFNVDENTTYASRSSIITISGKDAAPVAIMVNQEQTDAIIPEKMLYSVGLTGGALAIKLQANIDYTIEVPEKYASWLHYEPKTLPQPESHTLVDQTENFTIDAATGLRGGKIVITSADGKIIKTVNVVQSGETHIYATIPDLKFRTWLENNDYIVVVDGAKCELTEIAADVTSFDCRNSGIASFEGIEAFTKLTSLLCVGNPITLLPLKDLNIITLDLSNGSVANLVISSTKLTELKLQYNTSSMKTLDVSGCPVLADLNIAYNFNMTTLYIKSGQTFTKLTDTNAGFYAPGGKYAIVER